MNIVERTILALDSRQILNKAEKIGSV